MAITNYTTLKAAVQSYCGRSDSTFGTAIEQMVAFVEDRIYLGHGTRGEPNYSPPVRSQYMETTATVSLTDGEGALPTDALEYRRLTYADDEQGLEYMSPDLLTRRIAVGGGGTEPRFYTIEGGTLHVYPEITGDVEALYFKRYPPLTSSSAVTDGVLLAAYPMLYLSGCLYEAFRWMQEPEAGQMHLQTFRGQAQAINANATAHRYGGKRKRLHMEPIA